MLSRTRKNPFGNENFAQHLKKILDISLIVVTFFAVALVAITIFAISIMGSKAEDLKLSKNENSQNVVQDTFKLIPQGKFTYELYFSEFNGRLENLPVEIVITNRQITVYNSRENPLLGDEIIIQGILIKHNSGSWIIAQSESDKNAKEIGGCTDGPVPINFETKIIEWC